MNQREKLLVLKKEIEYKETIHQWEEEKTMAYISTIERLGIEEGLRQGIQQGRTIER